jgi:copper chaperone CopZ
LVTQRQKKDEMSEYEAGAGYELEVSGMSCDSCVAHVDEALQAVKGVRSARVDLDSGRAVVEGEAIDPNRLIEAVTRAGYGVKSVG